MRPPQHPKSTWQSLSCDSEDPVENKIYHAEALCRARGIKLTALRRQVLRVLLRSGKPLGAYEIMETLRTRLARPVSPPTVYRTLDFLVAQRFVSKIESQNAYVCCSNPEKGRGGLYFICDECGTAVELEDPRIEAIVAQDAAELDFSVTRRVVEIQGTCGICTTDANPTARA